MKFNKNKKGASSIEMVIGFMIFIMLMAFMIDVINVLVRYSVVAQSNTDISRLVGLQGGVLSTAPVGWPGGEDNYVNIVELEDMMKNKLESVGVPIEDWRVRIYDGAGKQGYFGSSGRKSVQFDFLDKYTAEVQLKNHWKAVSSFVPGMITQTFTSRRPVISEWKYNYNDWIGE